MKKKLILLGLSVLLVGLAAFSYTTGLLPTIAAEKMALRAAGTPPQLNISVSVVRVEPHAFVETLALGGSLVPREEILIGPEIEGLRVLEVLVEEGASVKRGQVLARLVPDTLDALLAQNEAALARNAAATAQARSVISEAEARLKEAQNAMVRTRTLKESGHVSDAVFDQREAAFKLAEAQLVAARDGLKASEADRASIEAQRRDLLWRRSKTDVTAPADGVISHRRARIGATAALVSQEPMFRMIANGQIELDAEVPQAHIVRMAVGQKARIAIPGNGDIDGTVRLVLPAVDPVTRLGRVRILLGNDPSLHIGTFARGEVIIARGSGLAVPRSAVQFSKSGPSVQVVENDTIETRPVTLGLVEADMLEIRSGVSEGTLVVAKSGTFLRNGDRVHPVVLPRAIADGR